MEIDSKISQANGRLKVAKVGVKIERSGNRLILRGTFPPKPGSVKTSPHQQRIYTGIHANHLGVSQAEKLARKIGADLDCDKFTWQDYNQKDQAPGVTVSQAIEQLKNAYFAKRPANLTTINTWKESYQYWLSRLPPSQALTPKILLEAVLTTEANTQSRIKIVIAAQALAKVAKLEIDLSEYRGRYSASTVSKRDIPSDELIQATYFTISDPAWAWLYGVLATYGLRPHEALRLEGFNGPILSVGENTKTGSRQVWPIYPEWFELFQCDQVNPPPLSLNQANSQLGDLIGKKLRKLSVPFRPYDLRHAWAIRSLEFGLDISLAARQMGHSVQIHSQTYHAWIDERVQQRAYEALMNRPDRPRPPQLPR